MSRKLSRMAASCFNNEANRCVQRQSKDVQDTSFIKLGVELSGTDSDTPSEKSITNHNWIRSFSERLRNFRSGEFDEGIVAIRRRKLAGINPLLPNLGGHSVWPAMTGLIPEDEAEQRRDTT
ncbi:hypothetical protein ElyMa_001362700 [Elysia marginata]|uniref:Uncharacterized protein n=1 Tax=Elysia marginata TaxID=1093978 RepID=A0AAV4IST4_9GAST|nr:hypothetical protein ElyMa_001362700 [Elysia marginata]